MYLYIRSYLNLPIRIGGRKCTTTKGKECVFPFEWKGKTYQECTSIGWNRMWCGTIHDVTNGTHRFFFRTFMFLAALMAGGTH